MNGLSVVVILFQMYSAVNQENNFLFHPPKHAKPILHLLFGRLVEYSYLQRRANDAAAVHVEIHQYSCGLVGSGEWCMS